MIDGVKVKKLKIIPDERGRLMEILRADDGIAKATDADGLVFTPVKLPANARLGEIDRFASKFLNLQVLEVICLIFPASSTKPPPWGTT